MANLKKLVSGEIQITYNSGPDFILPFRFYSIDKQTAEIVAMSQVISTLIIEESPALQNSQSVKVKSLNIED